MQDTHGRRLRKAAITAIGTLFATVGFAAGAYAGTDTTDWRRVDEYYKYTYAEHRCYGGQATVNTPPDGGPIAYGRARFRDGAACDSPHNAPVGWLGVALFLQRGDGAICAKKPYTYNSTVTPQIQVGASGTPLCDGWHYLRSHSFVTGYNPEDGHFSPSLVILTSYAT